MKNYVTEAIGTFLFVFSIALAVAYAGPFAPLAIGAALMCVVYMGGHISGGHYNPAVTLAIYLRGKIDGHDALAYAFSQLIGAFVATVVAGLVTHKAFVAAPGAGVSVPAALLVEAVFTYFLALVVLNTATDEAVAKNSFYGLAIGFTVTVGAFVGGSVSGGAFNPAVGLGPAIAAIGSAPVSHAWIYAAGPLVGGALAALTYRVQHPTR